MSAILKAGYLTKEGQVRKSWKKRWFILKNDTLSYYKNETNNKKEYGTISLKDITSVSPTNYKKRQFCLALSTHKRTYYILSESNEEMQGWKEAIQQQVDKLSGKFTTNNNAPETESKTNINNDNVTQLNNHNSSGNNNQPGPSQQNNHIENHTDTTVNHAPSKPPTNVNEIVTDEKVSLSDFELIAVIGQGSFGKVVKCRHKASGKVYAMKMLNKQSLIERGEIDHTKSERDILQNVRHPFLMGLHFSFQTPDRLYFVMDFVNGGELFYHLQNDQVFDNERAKYYSAEILLALEYLHNDGIIYRDLKPENLLLDIDGHIKMTDFGLSKQGFNDSTDRTDTFCGTPEYLAPEVLLQKEYGKAVDWWSYGSLIFEMLTGLPPFYDEDVQKMYSFKMTSELEIPDDVVPDAADLIRKLLVRNPDNRLQDPSEIKKHPWFSNMNWDDLIEKKIPTPFKPPVESEESISCIDEGFLEMTLSDVKSNPLENANTHFDNFTYVPDRKSVV